MTTTIGPNNISASAITETKLAANAVTTNKISDDAITAAKILDNTITSTKLVDGIIDETKLTTTLAANISGATPRIESIGYPNSDLAITPDGGTIEITGSGFKSGAQVYFGSTIATSVTYTSSTSLSVSVPALSAGSYLIYVINTDGTTGIGVPGLQVSGTPTWTTSAGALTNATEDAYSATINAYSDSTITYSIYSGALPEGLSLNTSTGVISGTLAGNVANLSSNTNYNFSVDAEDGELQNTIRSFSILYVPTFPTWYAPDAGALDPGGVIDQAFTANLNAISNSGVTYTIPSGNITDGNINLSGATLTGTPFEANTYYFTIRATDAEGHYTDREFSLTTGTDSYQISRSLRFDSLNNTYLTRTPGSAGSRTTWTFSFWAKQNNNSYTGVRSNGNCVIGTGSDGNNYTQISFQVSSTLTNVFHWDAYANSPVSGMNPNLELRDFSAWAHYVFVYDTNNATSTDRMRMYINGVRITDFIASPYTVYPSQGSTTQFNNAIEHRIGQIPPYASSTKLEVYLAEVHFIDGQALSADSFGEADPITGVWQPIAYSGSYGTNGYRLTFSNPEDLGADSSGNGNHWTPNNFSVTEGPGNDSLVDSPTRYGTDTGAGGEVRGNYCTWNYNAPSRQGTPTFSNGNLDVVIPASGTYYAQLYSTMAVSSGKWYAEVTYEARNASYYALMVGIMRGNELSTEFDSKGVAYFAYNGNKLVDGTSTSYGATYVNGDIIGVALDLDVGEVTFYKNNSSQGTITLPSSTAGWLISIANTTSTGTQTAIGNFGQRPFAYTAPSGFKALCSTNLPVPAVAKGNTAFDTVLWSANGSGAVDRTISTEFEPDFIWSKTRTTAYHNNLWDRLRGFGSDNSLNTDQAWAEGTAYAGRIKTTAADSFTWEAAGSNAEWYNYQSNTYAAWYWKAGGAGVSNTDGTITSTVSANPTAGFSVVTYTGSGGEATVGHGLGKTPGLIIIKQRNGTQNWQLFGNNNFTRMQFNTGSDDGNYGLTFSSSTFAFSTSQPGDIGWNGSGQTYVAYCFASIEGFSSIGTYIGNGSTNGSFVYTGFRPSWILIKGTTTTYNWIVRDNKRNPLNVANDLLFPNLPDTELASNEADILSNGFKLRTTGAAENQSSATYFYMAFAESPFKYSLAR